MKPKRTKYPPLFEAGLDWQFDAELNVVCDTLDLYAAGYKMAADSLVEEAVKDRHKVNFLIYPIIFLYRHYFELRLKEIIKEGRCLLREKKSFPEHHRIHDLWPTAKVIVEKLNNDKKLDNINLLEHVVKEFGRIDPGSFSFRYPTDKKGNNPLKGISHINVTHISEYMSEVSDVLEGISSGIAALYEFRYEV